MAIWKQTDDWCYEYFATEEPSSTFPGFEDFVELWHRKRGDREAPNWPDFDIMDFEPWWGWIAVVDYQYEPFDFRYRLYGTMLVQTFQRDNTGQLSSELKNEHDDLSDDLIFYEKVAREMLFARTSGSLYWQDRKNVRVEILELPLSIENGYVTQSLSLMHREEVSRD